MSYFYLIFIISGIIFVATLVSWFKIWRNREQNGSTKEAFQTIYSGSLDFMRKGRGILVFFVALIGLCLYFFINHDVAWAFVFGVILSRLVVNLALKLSLWGGKRSLTTLSKDGHKVALKIAFGHSGLIGLITISVALLSISLIYLSSGDLQAIYGFALGASLVALFMRVGGGVYAKAATISADSINRLKKEESLSKNIQDSVIIMDSISDTVGDVAGENADLFESYVSNLVAVMIIGGVGLFIFLPIALAVIGLIATLIGLIFIRSRKSDFFFGRNLKLGILGVIVLIVVLALILIKTMTGHLFLALPFLMGLLAVLGLGWTTDFFTSSRFRPTQKVAQTDQSSPVIGVLRSLSLGIRSGLASIIIIFLTIWLSYLFADIYGIALASIGFFSALGIVLIINNLSSIIDSTVSLSKLTKVSKKFLNKIEKLDTTNNMVMAINKGFALNAAILVVFVLLVNYSILLEISSINILTFKIIIAFFIGGFLPFLFSASLFSFITKIAGRLIKETRKRFKKTGDWLTREEIVAKIATTEAVFPIVIVILTPLLVGFCLGAQALGVLLVSASMVGFFMALVMNNSGTILDNSKEYIKAGNLGGPQSNNRRPSVWGSLIGDFVKNVSGPSMNILLKLMVIISLIIIPLIS